MEKQDIAIVGISIYCPAGESVDEFWHGIAGGGDFITEAPEDVIEAYHFGGEPNNLDRFYCSRGGFCRPFQVDPIRYGVMPITASGTDPDQLVSMAVAEQALIDAGIFEKGISLNKCSVIIGKGAFSGIVSMRCLEIQRMARQFATLLKAALPELSDGDVERVKEAYQHEQGRYQADMATGTMPNLVASLVANRFDMYGPAYTVDAACASGIVAINHSINLLRSGQCDVALAGGLHCAHSSMFWGAFDLLGAMSHKQVIAPFSEDADGLLIGQGGGFLVLKTLRKAIEDGDRIYALIKETSVCSDGASSHVMVTSVSGQIRVLEQTWKKSGMDPEHIGYIEAHGTGTIAGDRTEINTLKTFFGDNTKPRAYVGSVKSNIGHAMPAAGMIGVIKTALALYWRKIPPTLHCERPLPVMMESRFVPPQTLIDWDGEQLPLIAGVNAFGFGGINAHAIMTAYEPAAGVARIRPKPYLGEALMLSAVSGPAMIAKLEKGDFTNTGGAYRLVIFNPDEARIKQAAAVVRKDAPWHGKADIWFTNKPMLSDGGKIAFMYPGFGLEWDSDTDSLSDMLDLPYMKDMIKELKRYSETDEKDNGSEVFNIMQKAYCTEQLCKAGLDKLGVEADMYAGHSTGEWDAVNSSGMTEGTIDVLLEKLFNLDAFKRYPTIAISGLDRRGAEALCENIPNIWLASDNCPNQVLVIGEEAGMDILKNRLEEGKIFHNVMPYGLGWHTPLAADELCFLKDYLKDVNVKEGRVPVWSASTLDQIPSNKEQYVELVYEQMTKPVYFRELIEKLYNEQKARIFIQIGLGSLVGFVEDTLKGKDFGAISTSMKVRGGADQLRRVMALLFVEGRDADPVFLGVKPAYRVKNSLLTLTRGMPELVKELPVLDEVIANRYGEAGLSLGMSAGSSLAHAGPIAAVVDVNIRDAISVQRELAKYYERYTPAEGTVIPFPQPGQDTRVSKVSRRSKAQQPTSIKAPESRIGKTFEERIYLTLEDHPYLIDHAVIRQPKDWPIQEDLNPVVPLTMTIEMFAEIAMKKAPGEKLIKIGNVAAYRWIGVETPFESVMKAKWIKEDTLELDLGEYAKAECTFGDILPEPPEVYKNDELIDIGGVIIEGVTPKELYDRFSFHGPQYHSCIDQKRICERGMHGATKKQAGKASLLDATGQQLGLFLHLTQTENTISFPVRIKEATFYQDIFDQEGIFDQTMIVTKMTNSVVVGDMVIKRDGKIWCIIRDFVCQRFNNIPSVWNVIVNPRKNRLAEEIAPGVFFYRSDSQENVFVLLSRRYLGHEDRKVYDGIESPKHKRENIISRIALKDAVRSAAAGIDGEMMYPIEFYCTHDDKGKPSVRGYGAAAEKVDHLNVSLAHKGNAAVAIAANRPVGIDLEIIEEKSEDFLNAAYTDAEIELIKRMNSKDAAVRLWVAKEACAKMSGDGLAGNPKRYAVSAVEGDELSVGDTRVKTVVLEKEYIVGWTL